MLARIAHELYWLGRNLARGEFTARAAEAVFQAEIQGAGEARPSVSFGSGGLLAMLGCSAAYHLLRSSRRRELLRCFDHSAIFLMIAGTYTPFTLLRIKPLWAIVLTSLVWSIAALGIVLRLVRPQLFERLSIGFYLALGWAGLAAVGTLVPSVRLSTLVLLAAGGLLYTVGVVFHVRERLPFRTAIWHGFVLVAAAAHYVAVLDEIVVAHASL